MACGWMLDFTKLMLNSTQVDVTVEVGVDLGKRSNKLELKLCKAQVNQVWPQ